ncbi:hypothetical protein ACFXTH_001303 [Malus domestica]
MALLNVSTCSSELPPKPSLSPQQTSPFPPTPPSLRRLSCAPGSKKSPRSFWKLCIIAGRVPLQGEPDLPSAAVFGGGPYGSEVARGRDLTGKGFSGNTLIKQDFKTSILRQANFKGAKLLGASFFDADLTGADLSDADLRALDFSLANVTKANMSNANLEGADATGNTSFKRSNIMGVDFTDVPLREDQREYLHKVADRVNPTTGNPTRENLLCN